MTDVVGVPTDFGIVKFEVRDPQGVGRAGRGPDQIPLLKESYEQGLESVRRLAEQTVKKVRDLSHRPDRVTLELGIRVSARAGVFVASTSGDANITLTLEWTGEHSSSERP
ncbi:MAG TPA: CU044_2847 family protein [Micromonosporaceae bacterium]|nr:CU044_2847 family protein [Micromonosporaceae bacterium]